MKLSKYVYILVSYAFDCARMLDVLVRNRDTILLIMVVFPYKNVFSRLSKLTPIFLIVKYKGGSHMKNPYSQDMKEFRGEAAAAVW